MRPDDVRWPAVREAARRLLRTTSVAFEVLEVDLETAHRLVSAISDTNPGRMELPVVYPSTSVCIRDTEEDLRLVTWEHTTDHRSLLFSSEGRHSVSFQDVAAMAHSLLEAGYPGCLGCGGPGLEDPWDEEAWRRRQVTTSFK